VEVASPGTRAPRILSRPEHNISRKNIDPDALRVLYRLKSAGFLAYLVGGGVRDLLLERQPKDFDIGTSAHPQQVRKLFRNCFIVGRRFRLAHVRFGRKVVEVSTFRKASAPEEGDTLVRRDNTFGTPEEDAFRRDFTVNALFYDIANFSVIDWVGGLPDLEARVIRAIGDPDVRFREDPVRMLRAVALAARLGFSIDRGTAEAIRVQRGEILRSSPPRLLEELYKVLRQGRSRETFALLHEQGLLAHLLPAADRAVAEGNEAFLGSLSRLDEHRRTGLSSADQLTNSLLMGSLVVPLGVPLRRIAAGPSPRRGPGEEPAEASADDVASEMDALGGEAPEEDAGEALGVPMPIPLPFARRDLERLRLVLSAQRRLREAHAPAAARRSLAARGYFDEALRWLDIHGGPDGRELAAHWRDLATSPDEPASSAEAGPEPGLDTARNQRPRRRRRRRRRPPQGPATPA
jgi:poly(A) polymerase